MPNGRLPLRLRCLWAGEAPTSECVTLRCAISELIIRNYVYFATARIDQSGEAFIDNRPRLICGAISPRILNSDRLDLGEERYEAKNY